MAKICSPCGCNSGEGTCSHKKVIVVIVMAVVVLGIAKLLNLF